jgi:hypothetical protein
MESIALIATAASLSLLAGWRVYACILGVGIAMRFGVVPLPEHLSSLTVLANPWVIGTAAIGAAAEFFADKIAWVDSFWDAVHTAIRPVGGALLALAIVDASDPKWQIISLLLGGGAALASHSAKAGTRAAVNASPEPFSNMIVSTGEDIATTGAIVATLASPMLAGIAAIVMIAIVISLLVVVRRLLRKVMPAPEAT